MLISSPSDLVEESSRKQRSRVEPPWNVGLVNWKTQYTGCGSSTPSRCCYHAEVVVSSLLSNARRCVSTIL